jgi:hypothetical protein
MAKPGTVIGWKLDRSQRGDLLERVPPRYSDVDADHVTLRTEASRGPLPPEVDATIIGHADDGDSLEAMVVRVDGTTDRPDGSIFHITWSLEKAKGRKARESNDLLKDRGWHRIDQPVPIRIDPARF